MSTATSTAMSTELECIVCGVGGQGTVLTSRLLASIYMDRGCAVKTAETIGMAQRGGSVTSHVRAGAPFSPLVPKHTAGCMVSFEIGEAVRCLDFAAPGASVIVNTHIVQPPGAALSDTGYDGHVELAYLRSLDGIRLIEIDGAELCSQVGSPRVLNVVLLASAAKAHALDISREELEGAIDSLVKKRYVELNLKAIEVVFRQ